VDDGVEGGDASPGFVGYVERQHVALPELDSRRQAPRLLHHGRRQVDATDVNAVLVQILSNLARAATHVARRGLADAGGEAVELLPVEGLVLELAKDAPDVFVRHLVVAELAVVALSRVHTILLR